MQDGEPDPNAPADWWIDWLDRQTAGIRSTLEAAADAIEKAGCPSGVWKTALRDYHQAALPLPAEQWLAWAKLSRQLAVDLEDIEERYNHFSDSRHVLRAFVGSEEPPSSLFLPPLRPMSALVHALKSEADICDQRAAALRGQRSAGSYETRVRCVQEIGRYTRGKVPYKALAALLAAVGETTTTVASLKMALSRRGDTKTRVPKVKIKKSGGARKAAPRDRGLSTRAIEALDAGLRITRRPR